MLHESDRVILKPFTRESTKGNYRKWLNDTTINLYNSHGLFPTTEKEIEEFIDMALNDHSIIVWNIFSKVVLENTSQTDTLERCYYSLKEVHIGNISLQKINWPYRSAEVALIVGEKDYWGRGFATEACGLVLKHAFEFLGLNRVWSGTSEKNIGMQKVFEKLGFTKEGTFRQAMLNSGELVDIYEYAILREEWKNKK